MGIYGHVSINMRQNHDYINRTHMILGNVKAIRGIQYGTMQAGKSRFCIFSKHKPHSGCVYPWEMCASFVAAVYASSHPILKSNIHNSAILASKYGDRKKNIKCLRLVFIFAEPNVTHESPYINIFDIRRSSRVVITGHALAARNSSCNTSIWQSIGIFRLFRRPTGLMDARL